MISGCLISYDYQGVLVLQQRALRETQSTQTEKNMFFLARNA
jgi:hypothetical protein